MLLREELRGRLLEDRGIYVTEACDACGQLLGPVRYTRRGEPGVWCSRECRGDVAEQRAIRRGGRPRKYRTDEARQVAEKAQNVERQREFRARVQRNGKPTDNSFVSSDSQTQKVHLSHHPLTGPFRSVNHPASKGSETSRRRSSGVAAAYRTGGGQP